MPEKNVRKKYKIDSRKWPGVYGYDSVKRRVHGKRDTCYYIAYRAGKRLIWEKVGWKGEGYIKIDKVPKFYKHVCNFGLG